MKKLFLSLVAAMMTATATYAQSNMIATLNHDGEFSTFYGVLALRDAHDAATHGDTITLSSGTFMAVNIGKALTIRGAGMTVDTEAKTFPTIISGDFSINIPENIEQRLMMEGLYNDATISVKSTLKNASFQKNRFRAFVPYSSTIEMKNLSFVHCKISHALLLSSNSSASCVNCYVQGACCLNSYSSNFEFTNCVIKNKSGDRWHFNITTDGAPYLEISALYSSTFNNCIIYADFDSSTNKDVLPSSCLAYYCVGKATNNKDIFSNIPNTTNVNLTEDLNTLFKTFTGEYSDEETFELTDAAKTGYKGGDDTEVGIYGGILPFDTTPTNPQITKCNVASKSTADGKLSIDIEVNAVK